MTADQRVVIVTGSALCIGDALERDGWAVAVRDVDLDAAGECSTG